VPRESKDQFWPH